MQSQPGRSGHVPRCSASCGSCRGTETPSKQLTCSRHAERRSRRDHRSLHAADVSNTSHRATLQPAETPMQARPGRSGHVPRCSASCGCCRGTEMASKQLTHTGHPEPRSRRDHRSHHVADVSNASHHATLNPAEYPMQSRPGRSGHVPRCSASCGSYSGTEMASKQLTCSGHPEPRSRRDHRSHHAADVSNASYHATLQTAETPMQSRPGRSGHVPRCSASCFETHAAAKPVAVTG